MTKHCSTLTEMARVNKPIVVSGFNNTRETVNHKGVNRDGKDTLCIPGMGETDLLCANDYAKGGGIWLNENGGRVIQFKDPEEKCKFEKYIEDINSTTMTLKVHNRVYIVDKRESTIKPQMKKKVTVANLSLSDSEDFMNELANPATHFFNGRVGFDSVDDRVLGYIMMGMSLKTLRMGIGNGDKREILGIHPAITLKAIRQFEKKHGRSPDILQLANLDIQPHQHTFEKEGSAIVAKNPGDIMEMDNFYSDFNEKRKDEKTGELYKRAVKVESLGGGIAYNIAVDETTGFMYGQMITTATKSTNIVERVLNMVETTTKNKAKVIAADSGVVSESMFKVFTPETLAMLNNRLVRHRRSMPHEHSIGSCKVEVGGRYVKRLQRLAYRYCFNNPNFKKIAWSRSDLIKLWGEIYNWAVNVYNLSESARKNGKSKYHDFVGKQFNIQLIRLLPIFSILLVRHQGKYTYGVYVGPHYFGPDGEPTPGAIRVAIKAKSSKISILVTQSYKCVSMGGQVDLNREIDRSLVRQMQEIASELNKNEEIKESTINDEVNEEYKENMKELETTGLLSDEDRSVEDELEEEQRNEKLEEELKVKAKEEQRNEKFAEELKVKAEEELKDVAQKEQRNEKLKDKNQSDKEKIKSERLNRSEQYIKNNSRQEAYERVYNKNERSRRERAAQAAAITSQMKGNDQDKEYFYDYDHGCVVSIIDVPENCAEVIPEIGYRAVVGPRSIEAAQRHAKWAVPLENEKAKLKEESIVLISQELAKSMLKDGADLVNIFPVYEEKVKEGITVYKVRLVGDGRTHLNPGETYSSTPSRMEFRVLMHLIGQNDWEFYHVDETRAFLGADYVGDKPVVARLGSEFYDIKKALYGLKNAPRLYQKKVKDRLEKLGYKRLGLCKCIYMKRDDDNNIIFIYSYVDDFIWTGTCNEWIELEIVRFREVTDTSPVMKNPEFPNKCLGMYIKRDRQRRIIELSMPHKIDDLVEKVKELGLMEKLEMTGRKKQSLPLSAAAVLMKDEEFDAISEFDSRKLTVEENKMLLCLVGGLLWIMGLRFDIIYAVLYLTWNTHKPRVHHLKVAVKLVLYLQDTITYPLVLGGYDRLEVLTYTDASLNTGPNGKSVIAYGTRLGVNAGLINAKATATVDVVLSSFEAELHGVNDGFTDNSAESSIILLNELKKNEKNIVGLSDSYKDNAVTRNVLAELSEFPDIRRVFSDNEAMVNFVNETADAKGVKHALLRLFYVRQEINRGVDLYWMSGKDILANAMTKVVSKEEQEKFTNDVQGFNLLGKDIMDKSSK